MQRVDRNHGCHFRGTADAVTETMTHPLSQALLRYTLALPWICKNCPRIMSRIEELPDDFDEALDLNALTAGYSVDELEESYAERFRKDPSTGVDKPAPIERSFEEVMYEISKTPLFMNSDDVNKANDAGRHPPSLRHPPGGALPWPSDG
jgi:hypothetical protein